MSVWVCVPSARPVEEVRIWAAAWRERGYRVALWRDNENCDSVHLVDACEVLTGCSEHNTAVYPGYAYATNAVINLVSREHSDVEWFVAGGDDVLPDQNHSAEEIAQQCKAHCRSRWLSHAQYEIAEKVFHVPQQVAIYETFGVCQPTGDRFANGSIDGICGSPWIGREFARRINGGRGPFWPEYKHMFVDEELQGVAERYGVFWQRPDLVHFHRHYSRATDALDSPARPAEAPEHLKWALTREHWNESKKLFLTRKANGFPGSEPL